MPDIKLKIVHSQSHTVFPKIVFWILVILACVIVVQTVLKAKKENRKLFDFKGKHFFEENYDKVKLFGTLVLLVLYLVLMNVLGFILASILFIGLFNILYDGKFGKKDLLVSFGISAVETLLVWFVFGYIFSITLP